MTREEKIAELINIRDHFNYTLAPREVFDDAIKALEQESVLDKVRTDITECLKALDEIEKTGLNIYLPNEMSGRRLTYQQCLEFIDKYKGESEK